MHKSIGLLLFLFLTPPLSASSFYKCTRGEKVVYSQAVCPKTFKQSEMAYHNGVTTETSSDINIKKVDPLKLLLTDSTIPHQKLIVLISGEITRLQQEIRYNEVMKANELQKLERIRFWQKLGIKDKEHQSKTKAINQHFEALNKINRQKIETLKNRKIQLEQQLAQ